MNAEIVPDKEPGAAGRRSKVPRKAYGDRRCFFFQVQPRAKNDVIVKKKIAQQNYLS